MRYLEIDIGLPTTEPTLPWWEKLLRLIIPAANPDLESYYNRTQIWCLEIKDNGEPVREIGFDPTGTAIVLGPIAGNFGYLIDSSDDWSDEATDSLEAAKRFEAEWKALWPQFKETDERIRD